MDIKIRFLGAAQNVTGSRYLLEANGTRLLIDCGLYQERDLRSRNWDPFPVDPKDIDAVLLTHAHLDHCGYFPKLFRDGFRGKLYCTRATAEIARIILEDSAYLQESDAKFKQKRHKREGRRGRHPEIPLYTVEDAKACVKRFSPVRYRKPVELANGVEATFYNVGHILGAAFIRVTVSENGASRSIIFSGDVGRRDMPILKDPTVPESADYLLVESTYGDRVHPNKVDIEDRLAEVINKTHEAGGNVVIPTFALERSQDVLYHLNELYLQKRIPPLMSFLDSPMAISVTEVFERHPELHDEEMSDRVNQNRSLFELPGLKMTRATEESKAINRIRGTVLILAGSGMCTGGRIKHHLAHNIVRPESTILLVGYQANGTLGRHILNRPKEVRIHGKTLPIRARVEQMGGLSAHADREDLTRWLSGLKEPPRETFVIHGEPKSAQSFADLLKTKKGWNASVPAYDDERVLD